MISAAEITPAVRPNMPVKIISTVISTMFGLGIFKNQAMAINRTMPRKAINEVIIKLLFSFWLKAVLFSISCEPRFLKE